MNESKEDLILASLSSYKRKNINSIASMIGYPKKVTSRTVWCLSRRILKLIPQFNEYEQNESLQVRSVILSFSGRLKESMSFASFDYNDILEESWVDSSFNNQIKSRFLFMRYQTLGDGTVVFDGAKFWSMPVLDLEEAHIVWQNTVNQIRIGSAHALPTIKDSSVAHVRPRATNAADRIKAPNGTLLTKKCFWLNSSYIANQIR